LSNQYIPETVHFSNLLGGSEAVVMVKPVFAIVVDAVDVVTDDLPKTPQGIFHGGLHKVVVP
jgi:hypothetical protein